MTRPRWILVLDTDGLLVPARTDALPLNVRGFRTQEHPSNVATKLNADLSSERVEHEFGEGARP